MRGGLVVMSEKNMSFIKFVCFVGGYGFGGYVGLVEKFKSFWKMVI